jgi:anti-sigma regulatory factor (Ser/Thr protein kinase)
MMSNSPTSPTRFDLRLDPPLAADRSTVRLQVPLRAEFASTVRVVVASIGADAGFTVDDIDDLRLAVSEVFSSFWSDSERDANDEGAVVDLAVDRTTDRGPTGSATPGVEIRIATTSGGVPAGTTDLDELAMTIIRAAVDEFRIDGGVVTLVKRSDRTR